jgi:hypothetical protein
MANPLAAYERELAKSPNGQHFVRYAERSEVDRIIDAYATHFSAVANVYTAHAVLMIDRSARADFELLGIVPTM